MAVKLNSVNTYELSWLRHPLRRIRANHAASRIARAVKSNHIQLVEYSLDNALARSVSYLRSHGVISLEVTGSPRNHILQNGYIEAQAADRPVVGNLAVIQLNTRPQDQSAERSLVRLETSAAGGLEPVKRPVHEYFTASGASETTPYNLYTFADGYTTQYVGPGEVSIPGMPAEPYEGELSVFSAVCPVPEFDGEDFESLSELFPNIIIKDETRTTTPIGVAAGGRMGAINFGLKRLYDLVYDNARYLLGNLPAAARDKFTVFLGKSNRYIRFFGKLMVGGKTLEEHTHAADIKSQFMLLTRPLSREAGEAEPRTLALVEKKSGKVKYILPPAVWSAHMENLMKKMGVKAAHGIRGKEIADELRKLRDDGSITHEEAELLNLFENEIEKQPDVWNTPWVFMEVIPGAFVAQKEWFWRLNEALAALSEKYRDEVAGKEMARVLRENGNLFNMDLIYLAMVTSDQGEFNAGFVGKFKRLEGIIDKRYLHDFYKIVRDGVFLKGKIYAINAGEAAEVISFSDEEKAKGEANFLRLIKATVTYSRQLAEEWQYWRDVLGVPTSRVAVRDSYVGSHRRYLPQTWFHRFRRDQAIINSTLSANFTPQGPCYIVGSAVFAEKPLDYHGPFVSIWSRAMLDPRLSRQAAGTLLYNFENVGPYPGDSAVAKAGLYATYASEEALPGSGMMVRALPIGGSFPAGKEAVILEPDKRKALVEKALDTLSPDDTAAQEAARLKQVLDERGNNRKSDPPRFFRKVI